MTGCFSKCQGHWVTLRYFVFSFCFAKTKCRPALRPSTSVVQHKRGPAAIGHRKNCRKNFSTCSLKLVENFYLQVENCYLLGHWARLKFWKAFILFRENVLSAGVRVSQQHLKIIIDMSSDTMVRRPMVEIFLHFLPRGRSFLPSGSSFLPVSSSFLPSGSSFLPVGSSFLPIGMAGPTEQKPVV